MSASDIDGTEATTTTPYQPPELTFANEPSCVLAAYTNDEKQSRKDNFFRNATWCPDGSCILTQEEDRLAKIFALPPDLAELSVTKAFQPYFTCPPAPAAMLGLQWYPFATVQRPETFCFARSVRDVPVSLVDGLTGKIRASYSIIDHTERFVGPSCMTFSLDGTKLYCGFESAIEIFDVGNPGATGTRFPTSPSRKSRQGQKGLISAVALCPDYSGLMAVGSYGRSICLYDASGGQPQLISSLKIKDKELRGGGVTQVQFHPTSPEILYTASRRADQILVWDTRNTKEHLMQHERKGNTNQRIAFSIDSQGRWLTTGDTDGIVHFFDTHDQVSEAPVKSYHLADDTISSASLHPYLPYLLATSGSRSFDGIAHESGSSDEDSSDSSDDSESEENGSGLADLPGNNASGNAPVLDQGLKEKSGMKVWKMS